MPGLLRGVARTAVIAGTATAVSNRVSRRQARALGSKQEAYHERARRSTRPRRPLPRRAGPDRRSSRISAISKRRASSPTRSSRRRRQRSSGADPPPAGQPSKGRSPVRKWIPMIMLASAQFVMVLDTSVMNVAISQIVDDLDTTIQGVQTAITLYTLVMAAFMLLGAKLGDILGRNRAFAIGLAIYGVGSLTTALSPNLAVLLIGWSGIEGFGAVLVDPGDRGTHRRQLRGSRARARLRAARRDRGGRGRRRPADRRLGDDGVLVALRLRRRDGRRDRHPAASREDRAGPGRRAAPAARHRRRRALLERPGPDRVRDPAQQRLGVRQAAHAADDQRHGDHAAGLLAGAVPGARRPRAARRVRRLGAAPRPPRPRPAARHDAVAGRAAARGALDACWGSSSS